MCDISKHVPYPYSLFVYGIETYRNCHVDAIRNCHVARFGTAAVLGTVAQAAGLQPKPLNNKPFTVSIAVQHCHVARFGTPYRPQPFCHSVRHRRQGCKAATQAAGRCTFSKGVRASANPAMPRRMVVVAKHSFSYPGARRCRRPFRKSFRVLGFSRFSGFGVGKEGKIRRCVLEVLVGRFSSIFGQVFIIFWYYDFC